MSNLHVKITAGSYRAEVICLAANTLASGQTLELTDGKILSGELPTDAEILGEYGITVNLKTTNVEITVDDPADRILTSFRSGK